MVTVLDATGVLYKGNAQEAILPGVGEELGVLDFHQDFLCALGPGVVRVRGQWGPRGQAEAYRLSIIHGIAKMIRNEMVILAEVA